MLVLIAGLIIYVLLLAVAGWRVWRHGDRDARQVFTAFTIAAAATQVASFAGDSWRSTEVAVMAVDAALLVALVIIANRSERFWPLWAAGFQMNATLTHFAPLVIEVALSRAYAAVQPFWAIPLLFSVLIGTIGSEPRRPRRPPRPSRSR